MPFVLVRVSAETISYTIRCAFGLLGLFQIQIKNVDDELKSSERFGLIVSKGNLFHLHLSKL